jgi:hypothetical protein
MKFEKLAPFLDQIEQALKQKKSPRTIAKEIGHPELDSTIQRYKTAVWNMKDLVDDAKEVRAIKHETARNEAVEEVVNTLDLINLGKLRAKQMLGISLGDEFETGEGTHKLTLGSASIYWPIGTRMMTDAVRLELELSGDDPESRKAAALNSLSDTDIDARIAELINRGKERAEVPS